MGFTMEFGEKLQELRKNKGLTQEELAAALFVSRTAVSKWESGRGYPNIESLRAISRLFSITVDVLLSDEEILNIAEEDTKQIKTNLTSLIFGLSDIAVSLLLFLPLFAERTEDAVRSVSLLSLSSAPLYLEILYFTFVITVTLLGILILSTETKPLFIKVSVALSVLGVILFTVSLEPYAAVFLFVFLILKALTARKVTLM